MNNKQLFSSILLLSIITTTVLATRKQFLQESIQLEQTCSCVVKPGFETWGVFCSNSCNQQSYCAQYSTYCNWCGSLSNSTTNTTISCTNNCNQHGSCNTTTGTCTCYSGYSGTYCSNILCPNNCSGHGTCNQTTGICTCSTGYTSLNCNITSTTTLSCPNNCSGFGTCNTSTGICSCFTGRTGSNCNTSTSLSCPNNCSSKGTCNTTTGICSCYTGYTGSNCNSSTTLSCPNSCSGHGNCNTSTGVCTCNSGYSGTNCNTTTTLSCPNNCSSHGTCNTQTGTCSCNTGFSGTNCNTSTSTVNETWDGQATSTRYYDCSGGSCGCSYGNENFPTMCESNAMFKAPIGNIYGAKYYGTAAASKSLGGGDWMAPACGKCYKISGKNNVGTFSGAFGTTNSGQETVLVIKITDYCPPDNTVCSGTKKHFDIIAVGFDWPDYSLSNTCSQSYNPTHSLAQTYQPCSQWMDLSQDPTKNCDCSKITESSTLRDGCYNFLSLGWDNPVVNYKLVTCPQELQLAPPCSEINSPTPPKYCSAPPSIVSS